MGEMMVWSSLLKFTWPKARQRHTEWNQICLTSNIQFIYWIFNIIIVIVLICCFVNDQPEWICNANVVCGKITHSSFTEFQLCQVKSQLQIQYLQLSGRLGETSLTRLYIAGVSNCQLVKTVCVKIVVLISRMLIVIFSNQMLEGFAI